MQCSKATEAVEDYRRVRHLVSIMFLTETAEFAKLPVAVQNHYHSKADRLFIELIDSGMIGRATYPQDVCGYMDHYRRALKKHSLPAPL